MSTFVNDHSKSYSPQCNCIEAYIIPLQKQLSEQSSKVLHLESVLFDKEVEIEDLRTEKQVAYTGLQFVEDEKQELIQALRNTNDAFSEYAVHRRDKGTAVAKLNAWNHLVFVFDRIKAVLQKHSVTGK